MPERKHILVIGGGPGGYVAAVRGTQLGAEVILAEQDALGGTCLNVGCIPTKSLQHSAELAEELRSRGEDLGVRTGSIEIDFPQVMRHKDEVSHRLKDGLVGLLKANRVRTVYGSARFTSPREVEITLGDGSSEMLSPEAIVIASGSVNAVPSIPGLTGNSACVDSSGALSLTSLPVSMAIIGGGVIGLELASAYAALGTEVSVIEALPSLLPMFDKDMTALAVRGMKKLGIHFYMGCSVEEIKSVPAGAEVYFVGKEGRQCLTAEKVLTAVGRRANTTGLGLENAGIAQDRGRILVSDRMETSVPGVYAVGDCTAGYAMLAHTASVMGETAAENIMGLETHYDESTNPTCVYMLPEAATVGLTEQAAKERNLPCKTGKFHLGANGKALILNGGEGAVKIVAAAEDEKVLGMQIVGPRATDIITEGALAIRTGASVSDLIAVIHAHPTVSEAVHEAALNVQKRAIHTKN